MTALLQCTHIMGSRMWSLKEVHARAVNVLLQISYIPCITSNFHSVEILGDWRAQVFYVNEDTFRSVTFRTCVDVQIIDNCVQEGHNC